MNSFKNVQKALEYEIKRQIEILEEKRDVVQETRLWDADKEITLSMRGKEEAHDYRYFPEPDLVLIRIEEKWIEEMRKTLPELPDKKKKRFVEIYTIPEYDAEVLTSSKPLSEYFEKCVELFPNPKVVSNWIMGDILRALKKDNIEIGNCPLTPQRLAGMLKMIENATISGKIAKTVFEEMYKTGKTADIIVKEKGLVQITDEDELKRIVDEVLSNNAKEVEQYRKGKKKLFGFFVGETMKATKGKANPQLVNSLLKERL
jgi:aspartyl-tRNA(Asn)/glutamyl-tRNA(Gln) amidotransferase subunit B